MKEIRELMDTMEEPTERDLGAIRKQIGRSTAATLKVAARCSWDLPQVVLTKPLVRDSKGTRVFSTLFWLTCPFLHKVISTLESEGWVGKLKGWSEEAMKAAAAGYREQRIQLLGLLEGDLSALPQGIIKTLTETGIGGIRKDGGIKCLHLHTAHQLATGDNPVGAKVLELIAQRGWVCEAPCYEEEKC